MSKRKYIIYKVIYIISKVLLCGFGIYEAWIFTRTLKWDYPYPALGIDIHNPLEAWWMETFFSLIFAGVPLILVIAAFIVSRRKIRSYKSNAEKESRGENQ